ncbi:MAG: hypothetical protein WC420_00270 [Candidatus Paceibacterota bacterium]|jgi:hypothetical protein
MDPRDSVAVLASVGDVPEAISLAIEAKVPDAARIITEEIMNWNPVPDFPNVQTERRTTS